MPTQKVIIDGKYAGVLNYNSEGWKFNYILDYLNSETARPLSESLPVTKQTYMGESVSEFVSYWKGQESVKMSPFITGLDDKPRLASLAEELEREKANEVCGFCFKPSHNQIFHESCAETLFGSKEFTQRSDFETSELITKKGVLLEKGDESILLRKPFWDDPNAAAAEHLWSMVAKTLKLSPLFVGEINTKCGKTYLAHRNLDNPKYNFNFQKIEDASSYLDLWKKLGFEDFTFLRETKEKFLNIILFSYIFGVSEADHNVLFSIELNDPKARTIREKAVRIKTLAPLTCIYPSRFVAAGASEDLPLPLTEGGKRSGMTKKDFEDFTKDLGLNLKDYKVFFKNLSKSKIEITELFRRSTISDLRIHSLQRNIQTRLSRLEQDTNICSYI